VAPLLRDDALGEVVRTLEVPPACDDEDPAVPERLEHSFRRLPVPPPVLAALLTLEVARRERPFGADPLDDRLDEIAVVAKGALEDSPVAGGVLHRATEERPQLDRQQARL